MGKSGIFSIFKIGRMLYLTRHLFMNFPVLKMRALPLLESIREESPAFSEAWRLRQFLEPFEELDDENVPANSILREFIGP